MCVCAQFIVYLAVKRWQTSYKRRIGERTGERGNGQCGRVRRGGAPTTKRTWLPPT